MLALSKSEFQKNIGAKWLWLICSLCAAAVLSASSGCGSIKELKEYDRTYSIYYEDPSGNKAGASLRLNPHTGGFTK